MSRNTHTADAFAAETIADNADAEEMMVVRPQVGGHWSPPMHGAENPRPVRGYSGRRFARHRRAHAADPTSNAPPNQVPGSGTWVRSNSVGL